MAGLFNKKKTYPLITPEMIQPIDEPVSTTDAKSIFKSYMSQIGYLEKGELSEHARYFGEEIKERQDAYKEDIQDCKDTIKEQKEKVRDLKKRLANCSDDEKENVENEIEDAEEEILYEEKQIEELTTELNEFKKDKRKFLVEYINNQISN